MKTLIGLLMTTFLLHGNIYAVEEIFSINFEEIEKNLIIKSDDFEEAKPFRKSQFFFDENEEFFIFSTTLPRDGMIYGSGNRVVYTSPDDYIPLFRNGSEAGRFYKEKCELKVNGEIIYSFANDPKMKGRDSYYYFLTNRYYLSDFILVKTGKREISIRSIKKPYKEINQLTGFFFGIFPVGEENIICYKEEAGLEFTFSNLNNNGDMNVLSTVKFEDDRYAHRLDGILPQKEIAVFHKIPYSWKFLLPRSPRLIVVDFRTGEIISEQDWPKGSAIFTSSPMEGFENQRIKIKSK